VRTVVTTQVGDLLPPLQARCSPTPVVKHVKKAVPPWRLDGAVPSGRRWPPAAHAGLDEVSLGPDDLAFLQYTGGTTGVAKGAMLSHGNMVANVLQVAAWIGPGMQDGAETLVIPLPLYHVFALTGALSFFSTGTQTVLVANPRDLPAFIKTLKASHPSAIIGVNTLFRALLDAPGFAELDLGRLKLAVAGGMAVQQAVAQRWKQATGVPLVEGYGLTETAPVAIANPIDIAEWSGGIGVPLPSTDAAIVDSDGQPLPPGEVGEIALRGPQVMKGYWQRPEETAQVLRADGWLRTGDMGTMDERGGFHLTDRKKDMIVVSGFKVFPNEVEDVLALHPGVLEAAVIGVPDERAGEAVKAVVVRKDPALTEAELLAHCKQHLTGYKMPRSVEFRSEPLPKSNIGKILRRELRAAHGSPSQSRDESRARRRTRSDMHVARARSALYRPRRLRPARRPRGDVARHRRVRRAGHCQRAFDQLSPASRYQPLHAAQEAAQPRGAGTRRAPAVGAKTSSSSPRCHGVRGGRGRGDRRCRAVRARG
jgi:long-chain acyl-CoA synthetase